MISAASCGWDESMMLLGGETRPGMAGLSRILIAAAITGRPPGRDRIIRG